LDKAWVSKGLNNRETMRIRELHRQTTDITKIGVFYDGMASTCDSDLFESSLAELTVDKKL
jgi:hypothetical protein